MLGTSPAKGFPAGESFHSHEHHFTSALLSKPRDVRWASLVLVMSGQLMGLLIGLDQEISSDPVQSE